MDDSVQGRSQNDRRRDREDSRSFGGMDNFENSEAKNKFSGELSLKDAVDALRSSGAVYDPERLVNEFSVLSSETREEIAAAAKRPSNYKIIVRDLFKNLPEGVIYSLGSKRTKAELKELSQKYADALEDADPGQPLSVYKKQAGAIFDSLLESIDTFEQSTSPKEKRKAGRPRKNNDTYDESAIERMLEREGEIAKKSNVDTDLDKEEEVVGGYKDSSEEDAETKNDIS